MAPFFVIIFLFAIWPPLGVLALIALIFWVCIREDDGPGEQNTNFSANEHWKSPFDEEDDFYPGLSSSKTRPVFRSYDDWDDCDCCAELPASQIHISENTFVPTYKPGIDAFREFVQNNRIKCLYHFTDKANLLSIFEHGSLLSWHELTERQLFHKAGGNEKSRELDTRRGLQNYVRLSFTNNHPMQYVCQNDGRIDELVLIEIAPEVIYWEETLFSNTNATANYAKVGPNLAHLQLVNFEVIKRGSWATEREKYSIQAEVMVKEQIPCKYFLNLDYLEMIARMG
ncbi:DUF4433 domain-containing protein [Anaerohalosphaera lusitana]|nr:DUF4433 domain-containing protein [Anaerohalosphaera lusitana]